MAHVLASSAFGQTPVPCTWLSVVEAFRKRYLQLTFQGRNVGNTPVPVSTASTCCMVLLAASANSYIAAASDLVRVAPRSGGFKYDA